MLSIAHNDRFLLEPFEMLVEAAAQALRLRRGRERFREHDEVPRGQTRRSAKRFARDALQAVAIHRAFRRAPRDREAQSSGFGAVRAAEHREELIGRARRIGEDACELRGCMKALRVREPAWDRRQRQGKRASSSGCEPRASFLAATRKHFTPATRSHA